MTDPVTDDVPAETSVVETSPPMEQSSSKSTHSGRSGGGRSGGRNGGGRGYRNHNKPQSGGNQLIDSVSSSVQRHEPGFDAC
jgi:hypothetical protein